MISRRVLSLNTTTSLSTDNFQWGVVGSIKTKEKGTKFRGLQQTLPRKASNVQVAGGFVWQPRQGSTSSRREISGAPRKCPKQKREISEAPTKWTYKTLAGLFGSRGKVVEARITLLSMSTMTKSENSRNSCNALVSTPIK